MAHRRAPAVICGPEGDVRRRDALEGLYLWSVWLVPEMGTRRAAGPWGTVACLFMSEGEDVEVLEWIYACQLSP